jgi:hypothetical protein
MHNYILFKIQEIMNHIGEKFLNVGGYSLAAVGIAVNIDNIKSTILFVLGATLLIVQIIYHIKKIKQNGKN